MSYRPLSGHNIELSRPAASKTAEPLPPTYTRRPQSPRVGLGVDFNDLLGFFMLTQDPLEEYRLVLVMEDPTVRCDDLPDGGGHYFLLVCSQR